MTWLTWRQFRAQAVTAVAALALFAILLAVTHPQLASLYATSGFAGCHGGGCGELADAFLGQLSNLTPFGGPQAFRLLPAGANLYVIVYTVGILFILIAPAITGVFWGAPLIARELETGTVPAMALTVAIFVAVQVVMPLWIRPHLLPADQTTAAIASTHATFSDLSGAPALTASSLPGQPGAWILSSGPVDAAGRPVSTLPAACTQAADPARTHRASPPGPKATCCAV